MVGFVTRRAMKFVANEVIDSLVDDPVLARKLKRGTGFAISAAGVAISLASLDPVGLADAADSLGDAASTNVDTATDW